MSITELQEEVNLLLDEIDEPKWYCGNWTWEHITDGFRCRFYCGSARCPRQECKDIFWNRRVNRFKVALEYLHNPSYKPAKFVTLTYRPDVSDEEVWKNWWYPWRILRKGLKRYYGQFSFMGELEKHKQSNRPHIHLVTNLWVSQTEWSERFYRAGGGSIAWVSMVNDRKVAEYLGKERTIARYLGKENLVMAFLKSKQHTIFASRDVTDYEHKIKSERKFGDWILHKRNLLG